MKFYIVNEKGERLVVIAECEKDSWDLFSYPNQENEYCGLNTSSESCGLVFTRFILPLLEGKK